MQPQQSQNMYATTTGSANGSNIRANQQSVFRGPPTASPTPRAASRQVTMQTICQQPMHPGFVVPTYSAYNQRQPTFQNPQGFPYTHSPMHPYFYPNVYMAQPAHRGAIGVSPTVAAPMVQTAPSVPITGPTGNTQPSMPIASPVVSGSVAAGNGAVLGVANSPQVAATQMLGIVSSGIPNHPTQPTKQPKSHPNRLPIIDPNTNKNILDDMEPPKGTQIQSGMHSEYSINSSVPQDSGVPIGSGVLVLQDARQTMSYNMNLISDLHHVQPQRDIVISHTPVVSAITDAPSIEIPPSTSKNRSKKIPIICPIEDIEIRSEEAEGTENKGCLIDSSDIPKEEQSSNIQEEQQEPKSMEAIIENLSTKEVDTVDHQIYIDDDHSEIKKFSNKEELKNEENSISIEYQMTEKVKCQNAETADSAKQSGKAEESKNVEDVSSKDFTRNSEEIITMNEVVNISTQYDLQNQLQKATDTEINKSQNLSVGENNEENDVDMDIENPTTSQSQKIEVTNNSEDQNNKVLGANVKETEETPLSEKKNIDPTEDLKNKPVLQSLISYKDGQWSPTNPSGKKQYNREQLLQLREAKASQIVPSLKYPSILPQNNLLPNFVQKNKRVQSMIVGRGGDSSNYGGKQSSMTGSHNRNSCKGEKIQINLSLNQDVKLNETDNAWKPRILQKSNVNEEVNPEVKARKEKEDLIRKVRGILNKLTPEKFETLVEEIFKLKFDTPDKMQDVMVLVFEKAIDEPNFSVSYAQLCQRLIKEVTARDERLEKGTKSNLALFRIALIDKTEREFHQNVTGTTAKELKLKPIVEKIKKCTDPNEKAELEMLLEEEERKIRRRSVGTVRFIGELFKISMLTVKIIYSCIETLLKGYNEDLLECLCKLLTTVGSQLERTPKNKDEPKVFYSLDKVIAKMQAIANKTDKESAKISSRVRFMLQDVIDLRKKNWQMTRNEAPKTMEQIEKDAKNAQLSSHYLNSISTSSHSGAPFSGGSHLGSNKRDDRSNRYGESRYGGSHSQRGDTGSLRRQQHGSSSSNNFTNGSNDENGWHVQIGKGSRITSVDSNKLGFMTNQNLETKNLGNFKQFLWNKDIRQSSADPSNQFAPLSSLVDKNSELDRDRDRNDRNGPRNKGSFHKTSMERDKYGGLNSRSLTSQNISEGPGSRNSQGGLRSLNNSTNMMKSTSQSKYMQQIPTRPTVKAAQNTIISSVELNNAVEVFDLSKPDGWGSSNDNVIFKELTEDETRSVKIVITDMLESISNAKPNYSSIAKIFNQIKPSQYCGFLYYLLTDYLHLVKVGQLQRRYLSNIVSFLLKTNVLRIEHFSISYRQFCELSSDLIVDIPELWLYIFQFCGPLLSRKYITINDLWIKELITENENTNGSLGRKFLKTLLNYCVREIGPNFTRWMWKKYNMHWSDFLLEKEIDDFVLSNHFQFIENETKLTISNDASKENSATRILERVDVMLKEGSKTESLVDYINGNISEVDRLFIKNLTTVLCEFAIFEKDGSLKLDVDCFQKICAPILQRFIDSNEELELECLVSMQLLVNRLEHPRGLLSDLFGELYDTYVIPQDAFLKWRDSRDQSAGKGVAVKGLNQFFCLLNSESSDENI